MGLLRFSRKEKTPSPSARNSNSSASDFISSSAFQAIIQETGANGSLLDDILKELHPTTKEANPRTSISSPSTTSNLHNIHSDIGRGQGHQQHPVHPSIQRPSTLAQAVNNARQLRPSTSYYVQQQETSPPRSSPQSKGDCAPHRHDPFHKHLPPAPSSDYAVNPVSPKQHFPHSHRCHHYHHHYHNQSPAPPSPFRRHHVHTGALPNRAASPSSCCHHNNHSQHIHPHCIHHHDSSQHKMPQRESLHCQGKHWAHHHHQPHAPQSCHHGLHDDTGVPMRRSVSTAALSEGKEAHHYHHHHHHHHYHYHYHYYSSSPGVQSVPGEHL